MATPVAAPGPPAPGPPVPDFALGMGRAMRALQAFNAMKAAYEEAWALPSEAEREARVGETHRRGATLALDVARANGGIYNKAVQARLPSPAQWSHEAHSAAPQFVASLQGGAGDRGVPREYIETLRILTDQAPARPLAHVEAVLAAEFPGRGIPSLFASFSPEPLAAASLAQVHAAELPDGRAVAVKVQHQGLRDEMASDFAVFDMMAGTMKPGGLDLRWLVEDLKVAVTAELDFTSEGRNAERASRLLARRWGASVVVPRVVWTLTTPRVVVMDYIPGCLRITDSQGLEAAGLSPASVAGLVAAVFSRMALVDGVVHGDPHAGNVYVRLLSPWLSPWLSPPQLVILDHGLYHVLGDTVRRDLCRLILCAARGDNAGAARLASAFAGPAVAPLFPLLLSPWFLPASGATRGDLAAAARGELPESVTLADVGRFLEGLHSSQGNLLGVLHSLGYTRGLLQALRCPEDRRLAALLAAALEGDADSKEPEDSKDSEDSGGRWLRRLGWSLRAEGLVLRLRLRLLGWAVMHWRDVRVDAAGSEGADGGGERGWGRWIAAAGACAIAAAAVAWCVHPS